MRKTSEDYKNQLFEFQCDKCGGWFMIKPPAREELFCPRCGFKKAYYIGTVEMDIVQTLIKYLKENG
jgi:DNA-directed RNA polymerase subunit RPC12/RpoP